MSDFAQILVIGSDCVLLETRCWVLQNAGMSVHATTDLDEAEQVARTQPVGLLLLCHSLHTAGREQMLSLARERGLRCIVMTTAFTPEDPTGTEEMLSISAGPQGLVDKVLEVAEASSR